MRNRVSTVWSIAKTVIGCAVFGLGLDLFLVPNGLNAGGISGLSMALVKLTGFGTVGTLTVILNLPLFAIGGIKIGKRFFFGSLLGLLLSSTFIDLFALLPRPETDNLLSALYGGALCGLGLGLVFSSGNTTGGSDIIVRLLKRKWQNVPIGVISICLDFTVTAITGIVFWDVSRALYSGIAIFVTGRIVDAVVYRFDYSKVVLIMSSKHETIVRQISGQLDRGATYLNGEGTYSGNTMKVILTVVKRQQLAELKALVVQEDPQAFIIVQEAHQVLGDGFSRYSKDAL